MMTDRDVLDIFHRQHGVAHTDQLTAAGLHRSTLWRAVRKGELVEIVPNVARLASAADTFEQRAMALQLQSAPHGYLSSFTSARIHGIWEMPVRPIFVTVPRRLPGQRPDCHQRTPLPRWVVRSESNWHDEDDVTLVDGFRLERPESMLFSIAARTNDHRFERIAEKAWHLGLVTPGSLRGYVDLYRRRGRSGVCRTLHWLDKVGGRSRAMQSNFEVDVLRAIRRAGLPEPRKQHAITLRSGETIHLDLAWPERRLAVEPGHARYHAGDALTERDDARDRACNELGWLIVRYSERAREDLDAVGQEIAGIYHARESVQDVLAPFSSRQRDV
jgi:very-short-patch-repair endonuclease